MTHDLLVKVIRRRMKDLDVTSYRVHQLLGGTVAKQSVYNFIEHGKPITTETLVAILSVLKVSVRLVEK